MTETVSERVSFPETESRHDEMHETITGWVDELTRAVDDATTSPEFQRWLDVQSRFHDYSHRNTLLISVQFPEARRVAGYRTWQDEFDRQVIEGASAIWIWAPLLAKRCPACENARSYHERQKCSYAETPPEEWERGLVGFKPVPVFDISQTEGEPLPDLETAARGDASGLVDALLAASEDFAFEVRTRSADAWSHETAKGICRLPEGADQPIVEVRVRSNQADLAVTLIHEYAHALLHVGQDETTERAKREVEAEAVAYVVGRYFELDTSGSAFYVAAWGSDDPEAILDRLSRISQTAEELVTAIDAALD